MENHPAFGRIIWGYFIDTRGRPAKERHRAVIITSDEDIAAEKPIQVVVISTNRTLEPNPANRIELRFSKHHPHGHPATKLKVRCAAICTWRPFVRAKDIKEYTGGSLKEQREMYQILQRLNELDEEKREQQSRPPSAQD